MMTAAPPPPAGLVAASPHPHHVLVATELLSSLEAAGQARRVVRDLLTQGRRPELVETACLLTSELVANAVTHAGAPVELVADLDRTRLAVEVIDTSSTDPKVGRPAPLATSGRGLELVDRLADSWGVTHVRPGKSVWFALGTAPGERVAGRVPFP
ncbi:ATP-binding protein [Iamia majanohamensis]|uniref:ATP-binding protein n=1 Tax=Iamia majanohamensis TaxID=467976 RepID=A0AAE9YA21_9ACTN|nr:ATP-binding protein [Iamia majanohamensis]WCO67323.1 ATP-binding protein [Iamia majanohamensis]